MATITRMCRCTDGIGCEPRWKPSTGSRNWFFEGTATAFGLADGATQYRPTGDGPPSQPRRRGSTPGCLLSVHAIRRLQRHGIVLVEQRVGWGIVPVRRPGGANDQRRFRRRRGVRAAGRCRGSARRPGGAFGMAVPSLKGIDPERYSELHHPGDDFSYDIFTQAAQLLGPDRRRERDPLGGLDVRAWWRSASRSRRLDWLRTSTAYSRSRRGSTRSCSWCSRTHPAP